MVTTNRIVSCDGHIPILDDHFDQSATQKCPLGTRMAYADGRIFHYAKNGAVALAAGSLLESIVPLAYLSSANAAAFYATAGLTAGNTVLTAVSSAGTASVAANLYADGFLNVAVGSGAGYTYMIKSHGAISSSTAFTLTLYDPIKITMTSQSSLGMIQNLYQHVITHPASVPTGVIVGVSPMVVDINYFFWMQTWGICSALSGANAATAGYCLSPNTQTAGAMSSVGAATATGIERIVGQQIFTSTSGGFQFVYLTIAP